VHIDWKVVEIA